MNVLVLDDIHPIFITELESVGCTVVVKLNYSRLELEATIKEYDVLIVNSQTKVDKVLIDNAINLKAIGRPGSGMENIDVVYAKEKGIACFNSPEGNAPAVAEHAIGMMLNLLNRITIANHEVKAGIWKRLENTGTELGEKTIGIIGYGNTGAALAKRLSGFGMKVLAYDKYKTGFAAEFVEESTMEYIYRNADIVSVHLPLTSETENLINKFFLAQFDKPILLVNTSRGPIVNLTDVLALIKAGNLTGACLDVFQKEPLELMKSTDETLLNEIKSNDKILVTPHIAGWTHEAKYKMAKILADRLKFFLIIN